ncbi:MAG: bifunctional heptose 7-phosphate kinase/heptose 1-phosphate adenyltransferase [Rhodospirillaceae bacterium TMED8]|nr:bifunctional heptose 7-phosphate kinase/heptose 1-phosphate adenyltransferase [Magnetovibrio sp.]OUT50472.1 MAG: bifunctional heptose 7-phosphate kinase/heptose 1-phosphate adenyltransferase [Rhodospirillaceae bacterium TMED8]|tara:strand:- start:411 stop:1880 length:1470 start_codon:yes stop_codon:yes gene_type:complete
MKEAIEFTHLLRTVREKHVLCVGDVMLDRYVSGNVERISPEAPVPVLQIVSETEMPGGAGNVARNLDALGAQVTLVSCVGIDQAANSLREQIRAELMNCEAIFISDKNRPTCIKSRYMAGNQQIMRADHEDTEPLTTQTADALMAEATAHLSACDMVVLSDYGKGVLGAGRAAALIKLAQVAGKRVIVDPKGIDYGIYSGADIITPNRKELSDVVGNDLMSTSSAIEAAKKLRKMSNFGAVLVTLSGDGMALITDKAALHVQAEAREVFDVSGAGDTVVAALAAALTTGVELAVAVRIANTAAGIVVGKVGTAVVYTTELSAKLNRNNISKVKAKVVTHAEALDRVAIWRRQDQRISFTNGCFDLLHPGHISLLDQAKKAADKLIVALNSDASTAFLKGPKRPIQNEEARATVLASLSYVDLIVVFEEDTPLELIKALKPDVLIKGADYAKEDVVGGKDVESWGGQVKLAKLIDGQSTTATIKKLSETE